MVDLIGDLRLAGRPIVGRIVAYKTGHSLNQKLVAKLIEIGPQTGTKKRCVGQTAAGYPADSEDTAASLSVFAGG